MIAFIDEHREVYGVEPICKVLPIAPSTLLAKQWAARPLLRAVPSAITERMVQSIQTMPPYSADAGASA